MNNKERKAARLIAEEVYNGWDGVTRKERVSLIEQRANVSRRYANTLYNRLSTAETVRYVQRM